MRIKVSILKSHHDEYRMDCPFAPIDNNYFFNEEKTGEKEKKDTTVGKGSS